MELQKRKPTRLRGYDYSQNGAYFITICTHNKKHLLSDIVRDDVTIIPIQQSQISQPHHTNIVGAIHESPENRLTQYGEYVKQIIDVLPDRFNVSIPKYVIMPNHIHMIIEIYNDDKRAIRESPLQSNRSVIDKMVGFLKMNASKRIHSTYSDKIWQRSYHDHIIRSESDYQKIWEYIDTNVVKWKDDCFYGE